MRFALGLAFGGVVAVAILEWICRRLPIRVLNYRGTLLPVCLGAAEMIVVATGVLLVFAGVRWGTGRSDISALLILAAMILVFLAGLFDDSRPARTRGLMSQLRLLGRGTLTSGIVKLLVIVAASTLVALVDHARGVRLLVGIPLIAGSANLWNLLDVSPGRALKFFVIAAVGCAAGGYRHILLPTALGAALALLPFDLKERGMLGDSGSNVLGFIIGIVAFETLGLGGLVAVLVGILLLHLLAETVTLSRIIRATPPLRWFDQLGRLPAEQAKPESGSPRDSSPT